MKALLQVNPSTHEPVRSEKRFLVTRHAIGVGLLLCSAAVAPANTLVTFQVDMSYTDIDPNTQTVSAHGSFNGWGAFALTNDPGGADPYLYTGTADVAANGSVMEYKYVIDPDTWEAIPKGHNRLASLPAASGASLVLPRVYFSDSRMISVDVTFQVDMAMQIGTGAFDPDSSIVYPRGTWNFWGADFAMTNDPTILRTNQFGLVTSNVYVYTYNIMRSPGETLDYKFVIDPGARFETPAPDTGDPSDYNNRFFNLSEGPTQTLPLVFFSDLPYAPVATNDVTFQVDMTSQVLTGDFDPATGLVEVRGDFNTWGTPQILCTNNPAAPNTNLYQTVVRIMSGVGATEYYKFWASVPANDGWEVVAGNPGNNRSFNIISGPPNPTSLVLPPVLFSDTYVDPNDVLSADTLVTFSVNMANARSYPGFTPELEFDQAWSVAVNGNWVPWWDWSLPAPVELVLTTGANGDGIYSGTVLIPRGKTVRLVYKYGMDDQTGVTSRNNEAPDGSDRVRYIRQTGSYTLPLDTFGVQTVETSFGDLAIGDPVADYVPVSWLGRPGVFLQTSGDLREPASWVTHYESASYGSPDGAYLTNYPCGTGATFFRLIKP